MRLESNDVVLEVDTEVSDSELVVVVPDVVVQCRDYTAEIAELRAELVAVRGELATANAYQAYSCGFLLFFVVCLLCTAGYKLLRIFF